METATANLLAPTTAPSVAIAQNKSLQGSVLVLIQFDVCEEIKLDSLRDIFGARRQEASFKHPAPGYVRFQRPPVVEPVEPMILESGERLDVQIKYYDYGVLSVVFELPFSGDWDTLVRLAGRWVWDTDFTSFAQKIVKQKIERARPALVKLYDSWLHEDYFVFHVREIAGNPSAAELLATQGGRIAQIVRGENVPLSDGEQQEIMQSKISYYPNDLAVISWNAAFLYDSTAGAETVIQLLEYANSQLLEFRHYDELLTRELQSVYDFMENGSMGIAARWRTAKRASRLHTVLLDVGRTDRARRQRHQVPERHVLRPPLQSSRAEDRRHRLQEPGQRKSPHRRRTLPLHDRPVPSEPSVCAGADGGHHSDHRFDLAVQGKNSGLRQLQV